MLSLRELKRGTVTKAPGLAMEHSSHSETRRTAPCGRSGTWWWGACGPGPAPLLTQAALPGHAHLVLDLLGRVREEDGGVGVAGTHFGLGPLQRREEDGVEQRWFGVADPGGDVPRHPEVRVLGAEGGLLRTPEGPSQRAPSFQSVFRAGSPPNTLPSHLPHWQVHAAPSTARPAWTWSMAHGMRHWTSVLSPKIWGKELLKEGAAWMAGKLIFPERRTESLQQESRSRRVNGPQGRRDQNRLSHC